MSFKSRSVEELQQIASYGAGFKIDGSARSTDDLQQIVSYASKEKNPLIIITGMRDRSTEDLKKIASYGRNVHFEE